MWSYYVGLVLLVLCISATSGLECFRCVYDMRKASGASVWNAVRNSYETNDPACFRPDRYNPGHLSLQRCSSNGHCNKQLWYYRDSHDFVIARGCDEACYNEVLPNVDLRDKGYDRIDIHYSCCDDERCNAAQRSVMTSQCLTWAVTILTSLFVLLRVW